jgi:hypothetical protein
LYGYSLQDPINGIDPYGLSHLCISPQLRDALANGIGTAVGCMASGVPWPAALAIGAASGTVTYWTGSTIGGAFSGGTLGAYAVESGQVARSSLGRSIAVGVISGGMAGVAGSVGAADFGNQIMGSVFGSLVNSSASPSNRFPDNPFHPQYPSVLRGVIGGLVGTAVTFGVSVGIDKLNNLQHCK